MPHFRHKRRLRKWKNEFLRCKQVAAGITIQLGDNNTDILVWLKRRPKTAREYGTLYHELSHALDFIAESHNLKEETEAKAYIYEFMATECNMVLWQYK